MCNLKAKNLSSFVCRKKCGATNVSQPGQTSTYRCGFNSGGGCFCIDFRALFRWPVITIFYGIQTENLVKYR